MVRHAPWLLAALGLCVAPTTSFGASSVAEHAEAGVQSRASPGYRVTRSIAVLRTHGEPVTRVEVLEDERLTPRIREAWWGSSADMPCVDPPEDPEVARLCKSIEDHPLRGAQVRLVSDQGDVLDQRVFERELAEISQVALYGADRRAFAVTVDYSVGFGSYAGPTTVFVEPARGRLRWLVALDPGSDKPIAIQLARTLKSGWKTVARAAGPGLDLVAVRCQPEAGDTSRPAAGGGQRPFVVIYERFSFDGTRWVRHERRETGFWETDRGFPARENFPP